MAETLGLSLEYRFLVVDAVANDGSRLANHVRDRRRWVVLVESGLVGRVFRARPGHDDISVERRALGDGQ